MAKSTPGTAGSKGGGNVVPPRQPTRGGRFGTLGGLGYGPNPLGSAGSTGIVADSYVTDTFDRFPKPVPNTGFPTRGGVLRSQVPVGRGTVPDNYDYGRNMPRRNPFPGGLGNNNDRFGGFPSPQPRYPMPRNPYSQPPSRYGRMQGPTGLSGFLSNQPAISQRQIDPATGFPVQTGSGKGGSKGGAKTVRSPDRGRETNRQPQPDIGMDPYGTQSFKIDPDILDRGTVMNPVYRSPAGQDAPQAREGQLARFPGLTAPPSPTFGNNPPPSPVRQYTGSPPPMMDAGQRLRAGTPTGRVSQPIMARPGDNLPPSPEEIRQSPRLRAMQMGQAGGRPNIRPAMNVGKATGGPVGLASLIGRY